MSRRDRRRGVSALHTLGVGYCRGLYLSSVPTPTRPTPIRRPVSYRRPVPLAWHFYGGNRGEHLLADLLVGLTVLGQRNLLF